MRKRATPPFLRRRSSLSRLGGRGFRFNAPVDARKAYRVGSEVISKDEEPVHRDGGEHAFRDEAAARSTNARFEHSRRHEPAQPPREFVILEDRELPVVACLPRGAAEDPLRLIPPRLAEARASEIDQRRCDTERRGRFVKRKTKSSETDAVVHGVFDPRDRIDR